MITHRDRRTDGLRWGFEPVCRVLQVSPSTIRSAIARPQCARKIADTALKIQIKTIFDDNYKVYGIRKIRAALARRHNVHFADSASTFADLGPRKGDVCPRTVQGRDRNTGIFRGP